MINNGLLKVKPIPHAAQPEYEFSIDTITGMSAPPTYPTSNIPRTIDNVTMYNKYSSCCVKTKFTHKKTMQRAIRKFIILSCLKPKYLKLKSSNFIHAITDPEKVIAPINAPNTISIKDATFIEPGTPIP